MICDGADDREREPAELHERCRALRPHGTRKGPTSIADIPSIAYIRRETTQSDTNKQYGERALRLRKSILIGMTCCLALTMTLAARADACERSDRRPISVSVGADGMPAVDADSLTVCEGDTVRWVFKGAARDFSILFTSDADSPFDWNVQTGGPSPGPSKAARRRTASEPRTSTTSRSTETPSIPGSSSNPERPPASRDNRQESSGRASFVPEVIIIVREPKGHAAGRAARGWTCPGLPVRRPPRVVRRSERQRRGARRHGPALQDHLRDLSRGAGDQGTADGHAAPAAGRPDPDGHGTRQDAAAGGRPEAGTARATREVAGRRGRRQARRLDRRPAPARARRPCR